MNITRNLTLALALRSIGFAVAFESGNKPGWKLDAEGKIEMRDGNPVYVDAQGKELAMGHDTISRLNGEARGHRERAEAAEAIVTKYKPLIDAGVEPDDALNAINTTKDISAGDLIKKGEAERVRQEATQQVQAKLDAAEKKANELNAKLNDTYLDNAFKSSKWIEDNIAIPRDMLKASFDKNFLVEDGKIFAKDANGNKMLSPKNGGEYASFDEAMATMVESYPHKDQILKGGNQSGSGNNGGGGNGGGARIVRRQEWEQMTPVKKAETATAAGKGELTIVD